MPVRATCGGAQVTEMDVPAELVPEMEAKRAELVERVSEVRAASVCLGCVLVTPARTRQGAAPAPPPAPAVAARHAFRLSVLLAPRIDAHYAAGFPARE